MKSLYEYSLYKIGPRFENAYINLILFSETDRNDYMGVGKIMKRRLPDDICGVTSFVKWYGDENGPRPVILVFINKEKITDDKLRLVFETLPHELYHAMGEVEACSKIEPGGEPLAKEFGKACRIFQLRLLDELGYEVVPKKVEEENR